MSVKKAYLRKIRNSILNYNKNINEAHDLDFLKIMNYTKNNIQNVKLLLQNKNLKDLDLIPEGLMAEETLILVKFYDQGDNLCIALVYDNDKLWQDPEILEIHYL